MFVLGDETFRIVEAAITVEIRSAVDASSMEVPSCNVSLSVQCEEKRIRNPPNKSRAIWRPRAYLDNPIALPGRSLAALDGLSGRYSGALHVFEHRTLVTKKLSFTMVDRRHFDFTWDGAARVAGQELKAEIASRATFAGVTVYEADPEAALALFRSYLDDDDLIQQPPTLYTKGRRTWLLFGPVVGRLGSTQFLPR